MPIPAWALTVASHSSIFGLAFATSPGVEKEVPTPLQVYRKELGSTGHNQSEFSQCLVELPNRSVPAHVLDLPCHSNFYFVVSDGTYLSKERGNSPPPHAGIDLLAILGRVERPSIKGFSRNLN